MSLWYLYEVPPSSPPDLQELVQVDQRCIVCTVDDLEDRIIDGKWADSGSLLAPCSQPTDTQNDGPSRVLPSSSFRPLQAYPELWLALMPALVDEAEPSCLTNTPHATSAVQSDDAGATPEPFHEHENDPCGGNTAEIALGRSEKEGMVGDMLPQEDSDDNRQLKRKQQKTRKNRESKGDKLITPSREWFDLTVNTNVYVTGLPEDVTLDELVRHFNRAGVVRIDRATGRPKVKIYQKGQGDALVCYAKQESVGMACEYLDGSVIRPGFVLHVEPAVFQQKPGTNYMPKAPQDISTTDRAATMRSFRCDDDDDAPLNAKKPRILTSQHPVDARLVWIPVFRETVLTETTQHGTLSHRARCRVLEDHVRAVCEQTAPVEHIKYYRNEHAFTVLFATPEEAQQVLLALQNGCTFPSATMYCCTDHYEKKKGKVNPALSGDVAP